MLKTLPEHLHSKIRSMSDTKMTSIMDMMKIRIHFYSDLLNHTYFFEEPVYDSPITSKFMHKLKQSNEVNSEILKDLLQIFKTNFTDNDVISKDEVNRICSLYLYENKDKGYKNEDVFFLLRYAVSGNPVGAPTGEICEVIGYKQMIKRIEKTIDHLT